MGILIPENFSMARLCNAERLVVEALCEQLSDSWMVMPDVAISADRDYQMDVVIAHERDGIAVIEVKGHRVAVKAGQWCCDGLPLVPQPVSQAKTHAYALRERLRRSWPPLSHVDVSYMVAMGCAICCRLCAPMPNSRGTQSCMPGALDGNLMPFALPKSGCWKGLTPTAA